MVTKMDSLRERERLHNTVCKTTEVLHVWYVSFWSHPSHTRLMWAAMALGTCGPTSGFIWARNAINQLGQSQGRENWNMAYTGEHESTVLTGNRCMEDTKCSNRQQW